MNGHPHEWPASDRVLRRRACDAGKRIRTRDRKIKQPTAIAAKDRRIGRPMEWHWDTKEEE